MSDQYDCIPQSLASCSVVRQHKLNAFSKSFVPSPIDIILWVPSCTLHRRGRLAAVSSSLGVDFCNYGVVKKEGNHFRISFVDVRGISWFRRLDLHWLRKNLRRVHWRFKVTNPAGKRGQANTGNDSQNANVNITNNTRALTGPASTLRLASWNVNGLGEPKDAEVSAILDTLHVDFCAVQEHHLSADMAPKVNPGFTWLASPRNELLTHKGGGVGFLVKAGLESFVTPIGNKHFPQAFWLRCRFPGFSGPVFLASVYLPDAGKPIRVFQEALELLSLDLAEFGSQGAVCLCGDLNARVGAPGAAPQGEIQRFPARVDTVLNTQGKLLLNLCCVHKLKSCLGHQGATPFTCHHATGRSSVDYILLSEALTHTVSSPVIHQVSDLSDHVLLQLDLNLALDRSGCERARGNVRTIETWDLEKLKNPQVELDFKGALAVKLGALGNGGGCEEQWKDFIEVFSAEAETFIGKKAVPLKGIRGMSEPLKNAILARVRAFAQWKCSGREGDKSSWEIARQVVIALRRDCRRSFRCRNLAKVTALADGNSRAFFSALKGMASNSGAPKHSIAFLRNQSGDVVSSLPAKLEVLTNHYRSLGTPLQDSSFDEEFSKSITEQVNAWRCPTNFKSNAQQDAPFRLEEVSDTLLKMKGGKSADLDGFVIEIFKAGGNYVAQALTTLFNAVLTAETVPADWRQGYIVSIFKSGDSYDPGNYRGITVLNVVGKIFASVLLARLSRAIPLHESQAAFRKGRTCVEHIFSLSQLVQARRRAGLGTYAFFLDIQKAYDTVWRDGLLFKLYNKGVDGKLWRIIVDMLSKSASRVRLEGEFSEAFSLLQGVPQGCPLSTLLFNVFIDDLADDVASKCRGMGFNLNRENSTDEAAIFELISLLFADDFAGVADSPHSLQLIINVAAEHSKKWRYLVGIRKCGVLHFKAPESPPADPTVFFFGTLIIPNVLKYKYLGALFHEDASWVQHVELVKIVGQKVVFKWLKALASKGLSFGCKRKILYNFILPSLTHGAEVWDATQTDKKALDAIIRVALRVMLGVSRCTPTELLHWDTGVQPVSTRLDAAKLRWEARLLSLNSRSVTLAMRDYVAGPSVTRGRAQAGTFWKKNVQSLRDTLKSIGILYPCKRSQEPEEEAVEVVTAATVETPVTATVVRSKRNNKALNNNLWLRDIAKVFKKPRAARWSEDARTLWYPKCMEVESPGLQEHLQHLPFLDGRLVSLARIGISNPDSLVFKTRVPGSVFTVPQGLSTCPHCNLRLNNVKHAASHILGASCSSLDTARATFIRSLTDIVDPGLENFFRDPENMGQKWAEALLCPADICHAKTIPKIKADNKKPYWQAVATFVRYATQHNVILDEYESDDEIDLRFSRSDRIGVEESE